MADLALLGAAAVATAFIATYLTSGPLGRKLAAARVVGPDLHRPDHPLVPRAGGLAVLTGFLAGMVVAGTLAFNPTIMVLSVLTVTLGAFLGLADDILTLRRRTLLALSLTIGTPFLTYHAGSPIVGLTPFGPADLGLWFWPLSLLGVAYVSNVVNIYAGFNGLEAGNGLITAGSLVVVAVLFGSSESAVLLAIGGGALLAFLPHNLAPARLFIGNSGTYLLGALLSVAVITGNIKIAGAIATLPYTINAALRLVSGLKWSVGRLLPDGRIIADRFEALWALPILGRPRSERGAVAILWGIQLVFGLAAIAYGFWATRIRSL